MPLRELRNRKNRSMLVGLYSLTGLSVAFLFVFLLFLFIHIFINLSFENLWQIYPDLLASLLSVFKAVFCALPVCAAIAYLYIIHSHSKFSPLIKTFLYWLVQTPLLLFAVGLLYIFDSTLESLFLGLIFIAIIKLSHRWIDVSAKIRLIEIQSMQSLGFSRPVIIYHLYIRRFYKNYLCHLISMVFYLLVLVTPFLCLLPKGENLFNFLSVDFFASIAKDQQKTASLAIVFVVFHFIRSSLDQWTGYHEVEYG